MLCYVTLGKLPALSEPVSLFEEVNIISLLGCYEEQMKAQNQPLVPGAAVTKRHKGMAGFAPLQGPWKLGWPWMMGQRGVTLCTSIPAQRCQEMVGGASSLRMQSENSEQKLPEIAGLRAGLPRPPGRSAHGGRLAKVWVSPHRERPFPGHMRLQPLN
jgi:hypothetical protein